jgi:hypothetical protein
LVPFKARLISQGDLQERDHNCCFLQRMPTYRATIRDKQKRPLLRTTFDASSEPEAMERARVTLPTAGKSRSRGWVTLWRPSDEKS